MIWIACGGLLDDAPGGATDSHPVMHGHGVSAVLGRVRRQRVISVVSAVVNLVVALTLLLHVRADGILVSMMGNWPPPFGIAVVADLLSSIMVVLSATMGLTVLYSFGDIDQAGARGLPLPLAVDGHQWLVSDRRSV